MCACLIVCLVSHIFDDLFVLSSFMNQYFLSVFLCTVMVLVGVTWGWLARSLFIHYKATALVFSDLLMSVSIVIHNNST